VDFEEDLSCGGVGKGYGHGMEDESWVTTMELDGKIEGRRSNWGDGGSKR
jgi:hypothetical protein